MNSIFDKPKIQTKLLIYSQRKYGEPKLVKPKELKGIKQSFSVDWIPKKCKCKCFILNKDLYILHRDFGSTEVYGANYEFKKRFFYKDEWGCVVLRGEAWLKLENFIDDVDNVFEPTLFYNLAEQITGEIGNCEWERFFERVIKETKKY